MCGIIGYIGNTTATPILMDGLSKLEYRGYDSSGIAVIGSNHHLDIRKSTGKISILAQSLEINSPQGNTGIGHTRWATHGSPTGNNSHPHADCQKEIAVVHNGIVENVLDLRQTLENEGHVFSSLTDSECIPHLIEKNLKNPSSLEEAVLKTANQIEGAHAVVVISKHDPNKLIAFKLGNAGGIVVGYTQNGMFLSSDISAIIPYTKKVAYLNAGEMVSITQNQANYSLIDGTHIEKSPSEISYDSISAAKGQYKHFMLKEIVEQPEAVVNTMRGFVSFDNSVLSTDNFPLSDDQINNINKVVLVGMGTSLNAAMIGKTWIETISRISAETENSSEFRYRDSVIDDKTLVVSISQSGETADTLAAMEKAASLGAQQITLSNYPDKQTSRIANGTILMRAGPEIAVAASKTFTCSLTCLYLLALHLGFKRGLIEEARLSELISDLAYIPGALGQMLSDQKQYLKLSQILSKYSDFLYLGRGPYYPIAMEGALKLKEISYIHAEGYQAGEMKHGPISLIDENMPVIALMPDNNLYEKMFSNISEVKARGGKLIVIATEGNSDISKLADHVIYIPKVSDLVAPIIGSIPMQLLAYHIAIRRGCDVDQPRNLAKSVTVE